MTCATRSKRTDMTPRDTALELHELIRDSDEYCAIYGAEPPTLFAISTPRLVPSNKQEYDTIAWRTTGGNLITIRERISQIPAHELPKMLSAKSMDEALEKLSSASDEELARILFWNTFALDREEIVPAKTVWDIDPTAIFLTHDEASETLEQHKLTYANGAKIMALPIQKDSNLAKMIEVIRAWDKI